MHASVKKPRNITRALRHRDNLNRTALRPVDNEVYADRPEENGKPGEVFTFMTHARILSERLKRFKKFRDPAVRSVDSALAM